MDEEENGGNHGSGSMKMSAIGEKSSLGKEIVLFW